MQRDSVGSQNEVHLWRDAAVGKAVVHAVQTICSDTGKGLIDSFLLHFSAETAATEVGSAVNMRLQLPLVAHIGTFDRFQFPM